MSNTNKGLALQGCPILCLNILIPGSHAQEAHRFGGQDINPGQGDLQACLNKYLLLGFHAQLLVTADLHVCRRGLLENPLRNTGGTSHNIGKAGWIRLEQDGRHDGDAPLALVHAALDVAKQPHSPTSGRIFVWALIASPWPVLLNCLFPSLSVVVLFLFSPPCPPSQGPPLTVPPPCLPLHRHLVI